MSFTLSPESIHQLSKLLADAQASRYLSAVGLVALIYDHILTLPDEVSLIWKAPNSYAKYGFLLNRYIVPAALIAIAYEMCGFTPPLTDQDCQHFLAFSSMAAVVSIGIANALVLVRMILLWENKLAAKRLLTGGFLISFSATAALMVVTLTRLWDGLSYNVFAKMCITKTTTHFLAGVWACPMLFEVVVLISTIWNAVDRPTHGSMPLMHALRRDGIVYFLSISTFRAINLALGATSRPELAILLVFFIWSMTTLVLNRSLLSLQRAQALDELRIAIGNFGQATSPFGIRPEQVNEYNFQVDDVYQELADLESSMKKQAISTSRWFEP